MGPALQGYDDRAAYPSAPEFAMNSPARTTRAATEKYTR